MTVSTEPPEGLPELPFGILRATADSLWSAQDLCHGQTLSSCRLQYGLLVLHAGDHKSCVAMTL